MEVTFRDKWCSLLQQATCSDSSAFRLYVTGLAMQANLHSPSLLVFYTRLRGPAGIVRTPLTACLVSAVER